MMINGQRRLTCYYLLGLGSHSIDLEIEIVVVSGSILAFYQLYVYLIFSLDVAAVFLFIYLLFAASWSEYITE